jgi:hypothetical protein
MERLRAVERYLTLASSYVGTKEVGNNSGPIVSEFLQAVGLGPGHAWCAAAQMFFIKKVEAELGINSKVYRSGHCMSIWNKSPKELRLEKPEPGCLIIWNYVGSSSGHIGVVESVNGAATVTTIEGNTSNDAPGVVREGDGLFRKKRSVNGTKKMKVVGFLRVFS